MVKQSGRIATYLITSSSDDTSSDTEDDDFSDEEDSLTEENNDTDTNTDEDTDNNTDNSTDDENTENQDGSNSSDTDENTDNSDNTDGEDDEDTSTDTEDDDTQDGNNNQDEEDTTINLTIYYKEYYEDEEIATSKIITGETGDSYDIESYIIDIDGYEYEEASSDLTGTFEDEDLEITLYYLNEISFSWEVYKNGSGTDELVDSGSLTGRDNVESGYTQFYVASNEYSSNYLSFYSFTIDIVYTNETFGETFYEETIEYSGVEDDTLEYYVAMYLSYDFYSGLYYDVDSDEYDTEAVGFADFWDFDKLSYSGAIKATVTITLNFEDISYQETELANDFLSYINEYRVENGLEELTMADDLMEYAAVRAEEIVTLYAHQRLDGTDPLDYYGCLAEICHKGTYASTAARSLWLWQSSESHNAIMLADYLEEIGIGCVSAYSSSGYLYYYWVCVFR